MATYLKDKDAAFKVLGDSHPLQSHQRSEARMKNYTSTTDSRAWANRTGDNRQYILDLMATDIPKNKQVGKFVPVDVLMRTLLGNKTADIDRLNSVIRDLVGFINELYLSHDEEMKFEKIKQRWDAGDMQEMKGARMSSLKESKYGRPSSEERVRPPSTIPETPRTSSESRVSTPRAVVQTNTSCQSSPRKRPNREHQSRPTSSSSKVITNESTFSYESAMSSQKTGLMPIEKPSKYMQVDLIIKDSATQTSIRPKSEIGVQIRFEDQKTPAKSKSSTSMRSRIPVAGPTGDAKHCRVTQTPTMSTHELSYPTDDHVERFMFINRQCPDCERNLKITRDKFEELEHLKITMGDLKRKLESAEYKLDNAKSEPMCPEKFDDELQMMANEIRKLRASGCNDEYKLMSTELQLLKKYCQKLIHIKSENKKLKQENSNLRNQNSQQNQPKSSSLQEQSKPLSLNESYSSRRQDYSNEVGLRAKLQAKVQILKEVTKERNLLQKDIQLFKERSNMLDAVIEEKMDLERRLHQMAENEKEMSVLKMRADKADELQRALDNAQRNVLYLKERQLPLMVEVKNNIPVMEELKHKTREAEILRVDRDRIAVRLQELSHIEHEHLAMQNKCRMFDSLKKERDVYKMKTMELIRLKEEYKNLKQQLNEMQAISEERNILNKKLCDLECIIADQENEISRLVMHIDRLSKNAEQKQDRIKQILTDMRSEIENKNTLISNSELQLATVQTQLKQTIDTLTDETKELKQQVCDANESCTILRARLERLSNQLTEAFMALEKEKKMVSIYKAEVTSLGRENERLQEVANSINELTDAGKLESRLRKSAGTSQSHFAPNTMSMGINTNLAMNILNVPTRDADYSRAESNAEVPIPGSDPPSRTASKEKAICTDDYDELQRLIALEQAGIINLDDITCVCKGEMKKVCPCVKKEKYSPSGKRVSIKSESDVQQLMAQKTIALPKTKEVQATTSVPSDSKLSEAHVCVGSESARRFIQKLEEKGELDKSVKCFCKGVQATECICSQTADAEICTDDDGILSKDVTCDCKEVQTEKDSGKLVSVSTSSDDYIICVNPDRAGQYKEADILEGIKCLCKGVQATKCTCDPKNQKLTQTHSAPKTSFVRDKSQQCKLQDTPVRPICECRATQAGEPSATIDRRRLSEDNSKRVSFDTKCQQTGRDDWEPTNEPPCREGLNLGEICVDDIRRQQMLQNMEMEGRLSLDNITCVCKNKEDIICTCRKSKSETKPPSTDLRGSDSGPSQNRPPCRRNIGDDAICVDTVEDQELLKQLEEEGKLSLEDITCVCKGGKAKVCECKSVTLQTTSTSQPFVRDTGRPICVHSQSELLRIEELERQGELPSKIECACKGIQSEVCNCMDKSQQLDNNDDGLDREGSAFNLICVDSVSDVPQLREMQRQGKISFTKVACLCKGIQSEVCKCENAAANTSKHKPSGPTTHTSGYDSADEIGSISKDTDNCDELRAQLLLCQAELKNQKNINEALESENKALRVHSSELKEVAQKQISSLSTELQKSQEDWTKTDDFKTASDLQKQNKELQAELDKLKKMICVCTSTETGRDVASRHPSEVMKHIEELTDGSKPSIHPSAGPSDKGKGPTSEHAGGLGGTDSKGVEDEERQKESAIFQKPGESAEGKPDSMTIKEEPIKSEGGEGPTDGEGIGKPGDATGQEIDKGPDDAGKPGQTVSKEVLDSKDTPDKDVIDKKTDLSDTTERDDSGKPLDEGEKGPDQGPDEDLQDRPEKLVKEDKDKGIDSGPTALGAEEIPLDSVKQEAAETDEGQGPDGPGEPSTKVDLQEDAEKGPGSKVDDKGKTDDGKGQGPGSGEDAGKGPGSGPDTEKGSRTGQDTGKGPVSGQDTGKGPVSGSDTGKGPVSGQDTGKDPVSGPDTGKGPVSGPDTGKGPDSGPDTGKGPDSGPDSGKGLSSGPETEKGPDAGPEQVIEKGPDSGKDIDDSKKQGEVSKGPDVSKGPGDISKGPGDVSKGIGEVSKGLGEVSKELGEVSKELGEVSKELGEVSKGLGEVSVGPADESKEPGDESKGPGDEGPAVDAMKGPSDESEKLADDSKKSAEVFGKPVDDFVKSDVLGGLAETDQGQPSTEQYGTEKIPVDGPKALRSSLDATTTTGKPVRGDGKPGETGDKDKIDKYKGALADSDKENARLSKKVKESATKINELENEVSKIKKQSMEAIRSARASFERDIISMQEKYSEGIEALQSAHEEIISQGNQELEDEIEHLREESIEKQAAIDELRCRCYDQRKKKSTLCEVNFQTMDIQMECVCADMLFAYLLRKILYCGLESLSFEDLQYLHTKICDATAKVMQTTKSGNYTLGPCCDFRSRQTEAQTQVAKLQMEVSLERQRLESLKKALEIERSTQAAMTQLYRRQVKCCMPAYAEQMNNDNLNRYGKYTDTCRSALEINLKRTRCCPQTCHLRADD